MRRTLHLRKWEPLTTAEAFANLPDDDQQTVEAAARAGNWIGKYGVDGFSPENKIWEAIEAAFNDWYAHPSSVVPFQIKDIFLRMARLVKPDHSPRGPLRQASPDERARVLQSSGAE